MLKTDTLRSAAPSAPPTKKRLKVASLPAAADSRSAPFSMAATRYIVREFFEPNPWIYWADFLVSWTVGAVCFNFVLKFPLFSWQQVLLFVTSGMMLYRSALFIHEIVHLRTGTFRVFRFVWNMLAGIPLLVPSFLYYTHLDHHRRAHFGTERDGEYIPLGTRAPWAIFKYLCQPFVVPLLAIVSLHRAYAAHLVRRPDAPLGLSACVGDGHGSVVRAADADQANAPRVAATGVSRVAVLHDRGRARGCAGCSPTYLRTRLIGRSSTPFCIGVTWCRRMRPFSSW